MYYVYSTLKIYSGHCISLPSLKSCVHFYVLLCHKSAMLQINLIHQWSETLKKFCVENLQPWSPNWFSTLIKSMAVQTAKQTISGDVTQLPQERKDLIGGRTLGFARYSDKNLHFYCIQASENSSCVSPLLCHLPIYMSLNAGFESWLVPSEPTWRAQSRRSWWKHTGVNGPCKSSLYIVYLSSQEHWELKIYYSL